jgi:hypothetical protein
MVSTEALGSHVRFPARPHRALPAPLSHHAHARPPARHVDDRATPEPSRHRRGRFRRSGVPLSGTTGSGGILGSSSMMRIRVTSPEPDVAARDVTAAPPWGGDPAVTLGCDKGGRNRLGAERRSTIVKCAFDGMKRRTAGGGSGPIRPTDVSIQSASCGPPVDSFPSSTIEASAPSHRP